MGDKTRQGRHETGKPVIWATEDQAARVPVKHGGTIIRMRRTWRNPNRRWNCGFARARAHAAILVVACGAFGIVSPALGETLMEAMVMAYQNNPTLQAQRASLRATDEGVPQALSGWRPNLEFVGEAGYLYQDIDPTGVEDRDLYSARLRLTQNLFSGFGTVADIKRAEHTVRAERARLMITEQDVLLNGVRAYLNVVRDKAVLQLNINNEKVLNRQLEATRDRFNVGEVTRTDVAQAEARLARARADRIRAQGDLRISKGVYEQIVGKPPERLQKPPGSKYLPSSRRETADLARDNNPNTLAALFDQRAAWQNVRVVRSNLLPKVDVIGQAGRSFNEFSAGTTVDSAQITAQLTVPLYQRGSVASDVREAKQILSRNRLRFAEARRQTTEDANSAWEALVTARARIRSFISEVRANRIALEGVQQEALVGSRTVLDVLDAEQELLDAQVNLARAERDETVAQYELLSAVGRLTAKSLQLDTKLYDEERHYKEVRDKIWGFGDSVEDEDAGRSVRK